MNDNDDAVTNDSGNRPFSDVLNVSLERRKLLKGSLSAGASPVAAWSIPAQAHDNRWGWRRWWRPKLLDFEPVKLADGGGEDPAISRDYVYDIILPWGDPLEPGEPEFKLPVDAKDQALQIGIGHDGMWYFPVVDERRARHGWDDHYERDPWRGRNLGSYGNDHGVLCINFEFGTNFHVLRKNVPESLDEVRASQHAHGVGVIEIKRYGRYDRWKTVKGNLARRIHVNTPVTFSGPAEGHPLLQNPNGNIPLGTVNNCAMGYTPWGTYLTCEENFNGYFGTDDAGWTPNEHNRFGWLVEIDPFDPTQTPVKRTALGRTKHEGASTHVADDGRIVVYMGDDQRFDYVYKFVSAEDWRTMRRNGESPLDRGTLYVARFNDGNTGDWLALTMENPNVAAGFDDLGEVLVNTRPAADLAGATPMDRPEWSTVAADGLVYMAMTNNSNRTNPNAANPRTPNADGHIIRWSETYGHSGEKFAWDIFLYAEDTHGTEESFADPDGIWADPDGRLFIQTDGGHKDGLNNQMVVADPASGEIRRLFTGVPDCEITGIAVTPDRRTMFINVQHPGDGDPATSNWPATKDGVTILRDATVVIRRKDGGVVGS